MKKSDLTNPALKMHENGTELNEEIVANKAVNDGDLKILDPIKRRKFLGMGLLGFAGLTLPVSSKAEGQIALKNFINESIPISDKTTSQTDGFDDKIKLLQEAWAKKDFRTARAITDSIRISQIQAQAEEENFGMPLIGANQFGTVASLHPALKTWANGWKYYKVVSLEEKVGIQRKAEPVEVLLSFQSSQTASLAREIRVAEIIDGVLTEVISQVFSEIRRGSEKICKLLFLADNKGKEKKSYLIFYGNLDAELPNYQSDLKVTGEGYGLDIENEYFTAYLSKQTGQLARLILKREHGLEIYSGGQGHGEPAGIDWAHDYVSEEGVQKMRISLWGECPDYEVVRGPICTIIRRWGFPYSPVHPLFSPARMNMDIEYRFYAGLPYFHKFGHMTAVKQFAPAALRDDEWVITGQSFNEMLWMGPDEKLKMGEVPKESAEKLWGIGFFNKDTKDSFFGLFLEHYAEGLPELSHNGSPNLYYKWHGQIWSRYPVPKDIKIIPKGAVLHQKNAYVTIPFTAQDGPAQIESLRKELLNPLAASGAELQKNVIVKDSTRRLARSGEAQDSPISKALLWKALGDVKDPQLYKADISVVDLGLIYDISVRGGTVKILMAMPHRGRPLGTYFTHGSNVVHATVSKTILEALYEVPGVRKVVMEQTWHPEWSSNLLTDDGRRKLGL
ncbi:Metal-sulfur cluster biosynthetic enzyme [Daejeonella rubra]|uniref:Metal-sulfur cluster biosynthetic enzyme n=1 Tax=Daejeonella rubra TaxID=990371 RepID=A0A1G9SJE7_9SPHI|nr:iron-sulfur cluster assembly protein [Daejeonella rubra]SDM35420.1 Metal-sulfur cluster biosynthetic enzyme [Daejeonella rubra]